MTVLTETHLIPNPHLNLFLSGMTHTRQRFPELLPLSFLVGTPVVFMLFPSFFPTSSGKTLAGVTGVRGVLFSVLH